MFSHGHQSGQGNALASAFGDEPRAQTMAAEISLQPGHACTPLNDRRHGLVAEPWPHARAPEAAEDRPLGKGRGMQPGRQCLRGRPQGNPPSE